MQDSIEKEAGILIERLNKNEKLLTWFISFVPDPELGYSWSKHPYMKELSNLVLDRGHSGASFAFTCRTAYSILNDKRPS